jgi:hypothetical protein
VIPEGQWLAAARRLAVGMRVRVRHLHEDRANMIIMNDKDRWWCYCQRCKEGGVVMKDHVILSSVTIDPRISRTTPTDIQPIAKLDFEIPVLRFLIDKNMATLYLPELFVSESRRRLLLKDDSGLWHGRDLSGASPEKWLNYKAAHYVGMPKDGCPTIVTEDLFSMYKTRFALRASPEFRVVCALGTGCSVYLTDFLMSSGSLYWFYDGDSAGDDGAAYAMKKMRPFVAQQYRVRPPEGLDPKDMSCEQIRAAILGV